MKPLCDIDLSDLPIPQYYSTLCFFFTHLDDPATRGHNKLCHSEECIYLTEEYIHNKSRHVPPQYSMWRCHGEFVPQNEVAYILIIPQRDQERIPDMFLF